MKIHHKTHRFGWKIFRDAFHPMQIEERMLESQELADNWREIKDLRSNLECHLLEAEQLLQSMLRRPAELEPKVAQNQLDQAQVSDSFVSR